MEEYKNSNRRIVKNTFLLYVRMLVSTIVTLYTSRIVLNALGSEDYGIYNVIAGFVTLLAFVNGSMVSATRRFLTLSIVKDNLIDRKLTFSASFYIHVGIALLVTLLAFSIGYYFLEYEMTIPEDRKVIANWVFVISLLSVLALCITVPHNALVVAYEKMGTFAFLSLIEVFLKLLIALIIVNTALDRLLLYAILMGIVSVLVRILYVVYCHLKFQDVCYYLPKDIYLIKGMLSFAGWNVFSAISSSVYQHGVNLLLNMFFGPIINAARSIAIQVQGAVNLFAVNFQQAVNPQITKSYAVADFHRMQQLVFESVKFSYFLVFIMAFPIIVEVDSILFFWLGEVPEFTDMFVQLSLGVVLLDVATNPFVTAVLAKGNIRKFQVTTGIIQLMILPISYAILKIGASPLSVYVVNLFVMGILGCYKVYVASLLLDIKRFLFLKIVLCPIALVTFLSVCIYYFVASVILTDVGSVFRILICMLVTCVSIYLLGLKKNERKYIFNLIRR